MNFFKIISGNSAGSLLSLTEYKQYLVSNNFNGDIYLDYTLDNTKDSDDDSISDGVLFKFELVDDQCCFSHLNLKLYLDSNCNVAIEENEYYNLPCNIYLKDSDIVLHIGDGVFEANNNQTDNQQVPDLGDEFIIHDDSLLAEIPNLNPRKLKHKLLNLFSKLWIYLLPLRTLINSAYQKHKLWFYVALGGLLLLIVLLIVLSAQLNSIENNDKPETPDHNIVAEQRNLEINDVFLKLPSKYSGLRLSPDGRTLYGVLATPTDIDFITKRFSQFESYLKLDLVTFEQIKPQIQQMVNEIKVLRVSFNPDVSQIVLSGIIDNMGLLDNAEIEISQQLPVVGNLDVSRVFTQGDFEADLNKVVKSGDYGQILDIKRDYSNLNVKISGYLANYSKVQLQQQLQPLVQKYNMAMQFDLDIKDVSSALPFTINEVYNGNPSYIVTNTGKKVFVGGVEQGITLLAINNNQITFKGKFLLIIKLSDLLGNTPDNSTQSMLDTSPRGQIIHGELLKMQNALAQEKTELKALAEIDVNAKNRDLKQALKLHSETLESDIAVKEHELVYYNNPNAS
jgi:hypothetical protein